MIEVIATTIGIGIAAFVAYTGWVANKRQKLESIKDFYEEYYLEDMVKLRQTIGEFMFKKEKYDFKKHGSLARFFEFFDKWSLLSSKGYLPFSVFEGSIGVYAVLTYTYLEEYIESRRIGNDDINDYVKNSKYAYYMEKLVNRIKENCD